MLRWIQTFALAFLACLSPGQGGVGQQVQSFPACACERETPAVPTCGCEGQAQKPNTPCNSGNDRPSPVQDRMPLPRGTWKAQGIEPCGPRLEPSAWPGLGKEEIDFHDGAQAMKAARTIGQGKETSSVRLAWLAVFRI